jgi:hypothetical protein
VELAAQMVTLGIQNFTMRQNPNGAAHSLGDSSYGVSRNRRPIAFDYRGKASEGTLPSIE